VRDPAPFGRLAETWVRQTGNPADLAHAKVVARWPSIVGQSVADHCQPGPLVDGVLTVRAETTAWATQLRLLAPALLRKIAAAVGTDVVRSIKAAGPSGPSWKFGPRHVSGRGPRDTYG
jgi:predicted nucleic acid-binding Zn ribbon protein